MIIPVSLGENSYDIILERGSIKKIAKYIPTTEKRQFLVVTDSGVPEEYSRKVAASLNATAIFSFPQGEKSKSFDTYKSICKTLLDFSFTRKDAVVAVGGGVVGDMAGFAAATYMRGIDFYNIPTTLLSQVDSSIGGKTGIDFGDYKNIIGAFHQPKKVIIDPDVLTTLPERHIKNGLAESIKMGITFDEELFDIFLRTDDAFSGIFLFPGCQGGIDQFGRSVIFHRFSGSCFCCFVDDFTKTAAQFICGGFSESDYRDIFNIKIPFQQQADNEILNIVSFAGPGSCFNQMGAFKRAGKRI